ncbi:MAG: hypothetical protein II557_02520 [Clostridia bacterium]|nr:hypothetical protein [Clostridia bacterium]
MTNNKKGLRIMAATLCLTSLLAFLFGGCRDDGHPSGGHTTHTDPDAPKTIQSTDLAEFSAAFYLNTRYRGDEEHRFEFTVSPDEGGTSVARETNTGISAPADRALTDALAAVIAKNDLAAQNGLYDVTAGLPPEYQAYPFEAVYASGERLSFTVNNNPYARWAEEVYDLFAAWFSAHGTDALEPELETSPVTRITLVLADGENVTCYGGVNVREENAIGGETYLLEKDADGREMFGTETAQRILFPDDFYERITAIVASSGLEKKYAFSYYDRAAGNYGNHDEGYFGWGGMTTADNEPDSDTQKVSLHLEYESGHRVSIDTRKPSEIEAMRPFLDELTAYLDSLF